MGNGQYTDQDLKDLIAGCKPRLKKTFKKLKLSKEDKLLDDIRHMQDPSAVAKKHKITTEEVVEVMKKIGMG